MKRLSPALLLAVLASSLVGCAASDIGTNEVKSKEAQIEAASRKLDQNVDMSGRSQGQ